MELLEKPADRIFEILRAHQIITKKGKHQFAIYIVQMHRRVQACRDTVRTFLPDLPAVYEAKPSKELLENLNWPDTPETRGRLKEEAQRLIQKERYDIQMHVRVAAAAWESHWIEVLERMTWHFFIAPQGHSFLTSDNPVFISEKYGLGANISELSFPISSDVCLVASWHKELKDGFNHATAQVVKNLNRRTASKASRHLYFSQNQEWVVRLLGNSHEFCPIFPADSIYNVVKLEIDASGSKPRVVFSV